MLAPARKPPPLPKYHQIYLVLREQLAEGRFDEALPGELALAERYGVARVTVRRALAELAAEGLVARRPGRGTLPTAKARAREAAAPQQLSGLLGNIVSMGLATRVRVLHCATLPASAEVAEALQLAPGMPVHHAVRVRSGAEGPLSLITTFIPAALARGITRRTLAAKPLLVLLEEAGVRIGRASQAISARLADADAAGHLDVPVGTALLEVRRLVLDTQRRPVQWLLGLYRPDRYQYRMQLSRVGRLDARVWVGQELAAPSS